MSRPYDTRMNDDNEVSGDPMHLGEDLRRIEIELARLSPRDDRLNRERLMFLAGQASLADVERPPRTVLNLNLESRAWPAAFAAMSAVAALLLVMVISKPQRPALQPSPGGEIVRNDFPQIRAGSDDGRALLSTIDAHLGDVEKLLARDDFLSSGADAASSPDESRRPRLLTPGRWHEVLEDPKSVGSSPKGASNYFQNRGVAT
jgi:hypothetical protein